MDPQKIPHAFAAVEVASHFATDVARGLSATTVAERLREYGPNELPSEKKPSLLVLFLRQFKSGLVAILLIAAGFSVIAGHATDAAAIGLVVLANALVGFLQERRAEQAVEKLRSMVTREATVIRDGKTWRVPVRDLVPGDILQLQEGDRVAADARIISAHDLVTDESPLTGESLPVRKSPELVAADAPLGDRRDMSWMGTAVVSGEGRAIVTSTGSRTAFGAIAASLTGIARGRTPLEAQMDRLGRQLGLAGVALSALVLAAGYLRGEDFLQMFFFAVALMVSLVPEGLPAVLAVVLAIGVQRMARRKAIIRHVPSVETLGAADVICTDKTGTLTENKMTVKRVVVSGMSVDVSGDGWDMAGEFSVGERRVVPGESPDLLLLLRAAGLCNAANIEQREGRAVAVGDPTEAALVVLAAKAGLERDELRREYAIIDELPFSSRRKFRAVLAEKTDDDGVAHRYIFAVGALEVIAARCGERLVGGEPVPLGDGMARFDEANREMAGSAMRVLAVAVREVAFEVDAVGEDEVRDMAFAGIIGMIDPPRAGIADAIARCRRAGIRVMMLTGDHKATAMAVGRHIGLLHDEIVDHEAVVHTDQDVAGLDDEAFRQVLASAVIFARVAPETKLRIVRELRAAGHVVAMTGDGVNDAPALKQASIGVAMGITGTDVTREVADMVLADDNFVTIVNAVEEGRIVFRNIRQVTAYLFMTNIGEVVTVIAALALGMVLPLLPAQILWMNLVTDTFPGVALATESSAGGLLHAPPRKRTASILTPSTVLLTALTSAAMCAGTLALFVWALGRGSEEYARTVAFTAMAAFQLWNAFSLRSASESAFSMGFFSNRYVVAAVAASLALQCAVLYVPFLQRAFKTVGIGLAEWGMIAAVSSSVFFLVEAYKFAVRRGALPQRWL